MLKHMNRPRHNFYLWLIIYLHNCWVEHRRKQRQRQQAGAGAGGAGASLEGQQAEG
jgi:DNA-directed RNA polymerase specialized sigma24 family protein